jgi:rhamnosyltransferase
VTDFSRISIVIPTLNPGKDWLGFVSALSAFFSKEAILILDSSSTDGTMDLAQAAGFWVHTIPREEFNHGGTRQLAADLLPDAEILVFLTQDVVLVEADAVSKLLTSFADPNVAAAFGRQVPRPGATPIEAHSRYFNYPAQSSTRTLASRKQLGIKSIFISNSFAAYRRSALMAVGGFPCDVIFGEDTVTAAKFLLAGWKIVYVAEAQVYHSHSYTWMQDFKRYFDIGVLHARENWLIKEFGRASGEGRRFVVSELAYLWPRSWWLVPSAMIRTVLKFAAYKLGKREDKLSIEWKRSLSMHPGFWK